MSVLGPGAACCQLSDCEIECDFVADPDAPAPPPPHVQVILPNETVSIDETTHEIPGDAPDTDITKPQEK